MTLKTLLKEVMGSELPENVEHLGAKAIVYSLTDCKTSEEAAAHIHTKVSPVAPEGSSHYVFGHWKEYRAGGLVNGSGPVLFLTEVDFYRESEN